jgi:protein SCO1/2
MSGKLRALVIGAAMIAAAAIGWLLSDWMLAEKGDPHHATPAKSSIGGPFALTDGDGKTWTDKNFRGKLMVIYFGYAYCPDVCPTSLGAIGAALDQLGPAADGVAPIYITIDPERDNGQALKEYAAAFHPRMIGLGGSGEAVTAAARAYRVYFKKTTSADGSPYLMDHSSIIYVMSRDGGFLTHFNHMATPEDIAAGLKKHL